MLIISAELSGEAKLKNTPTRTEGYTKCSQGQSIGDEIILPRGRAISNGDEKVCRYSREIWRSRIKSLGITFELPTLSMVLLSPHQTMLKESNF